MTARDNKIRLDLIKPKNLKEDLLTQTSNHHRKLGIKARISNITDFAKRLSCPSFFQSTSLKCMYNDCLRFIYFQRTEFSYLYI